MQLVNETPYCAGWAPGFLPDGREVVTVVVKASFSLRDPQQLHADPQPVFEADTFGDDPALDAPVWECDFVPVKSRCDVLLAATAYAPKGHPSTRFEVAAVVGTMSKRFQVVGARHWRRSVAGCTASDPEPFVQHRIRYDEAFGGIDADPEHPDRLHTFLENPSGLGFAMSARHAYDQPLPRTQECDRPVTDPGQSYRPQAFGPIARHWAPRLGYVGTYDKKWQDERMPFMPEDFNPLFYQCAPADQQIDPPTGGEQIVLSNLTADGLLRSQVPSRGVVVSFIAQTGDFIEIPARCDGITLEPDQDRLAMTWRASLPLRRDLFEVREMVVTDRSNHRTVRTRLRALRKPCYPGLGALVAQRGKRGGR